MARTGPEAVLLGDGRVLVVGGYGADGEVSATVQLWDPATGAWRTTESLNKPRSQFAAVALADGRVLVTGGLNDSGQSYSSTYVYDPRPGHETWSKVGLLGTARTGPSAAVLPDGRVLIAGGYFHRSIYGRVAAPESVVAAYRPASVRETAPSGPRLADVDPEPVGAAMATAELFDPNSGNWAPTGPMNYARYGAAAVTLADGRILVVGSGGGPGSGVSVDGRAHDSAEIYDPATGRFTLAGTLPEIDRSAVERLGVRLPDGDPIPAATGTLVALADRGAVLIGHGGLWKHVGEVARSFRFDASSGEWVEVGQPCAWASDEAAGRIARTPGDCRFGAAIATLHDGGVLVAGGAGAYQVVGATTASASLYDPTTDTWSPLPPMPEARTDGAAVVLKDGSVLLVGGYDERAGTDGTEVVFLASAVRFIPSH